MAARIAWAGSGPGMIPSQRANCTAAAKDSFWLYARASTTPALTRPHSIGESPW